MRAILIALALLLAAVGGYAFKEFAAARDSTEATPSPRTIDQQISQYLKDSPGRGAGRPQAGAGQCGDSRSRSTRSRRWRQKQDQIFNNPADPVIGNPQGDVTVVEFFDYRCPYCKRVTDSLMHAVEGRSERVGRATRRYPILGPESLVAAKIALAAHRQGKYEQVHTAFMAHKGSFEQAALLDLAASVGADPTKLVADMEDPAIQGQLQANDSLAAALGITGTPGFLFGKQADARRRLARRHEEAGLERARASRLGALATGRL